MLMRHVVFSTVPHAISSVPYCAVLNTFCIAGLVWLTVGSDWLIIFFLLLRFRGSVIKMMDVWVRICQESYRHQKLLRFLDLLVACLEPRRGTAQH